MLSAAKLDFSRLIGLDLKHMTNSTGVHVKKLYSTNCLSDYAIWPPTLNRHCCVTFITIAIAIVNLYSQFSLKNVHKRHDFEPCNFRETHLYFITVLIWQSFFVLGSTLSLSSTTSARGKRRAPAPPKAAVAPQPPILEETPSLVQKYQDIMEQEQQSQQKTNRRQLPQVNTILFIWAWSFFAARNDLEVT